MKRHFPIILLLGCLGLFVWGVVQLFELRFSTGDVYPPYSTLRADPLGAMAFYESLGKMPGISVRRDFSVSNRLPEEPQTVYFHLAAGNYEWDYVPSDLFHELKDYLARGGRLVITYEPQTRAMFNYLDEEDVTNQTNSAYIKLKDKNNPLEKSAHKKKKTSDPDSEVNLETEWGFHENFLELTPDGDSYAPLRVISKSALDLPHSIDWHSGMIFTNCSADWRVIYARGHDPVLIERTFGSGSVVIASDSYFISNEALSKDRHADLLAWLVGANNHVVFDEAHLGITDSSGVAALMRKYRLHGFVAGLLLLTGLFIWKNSTSLLPKVASEKDEKFVAGKDARTGFVNLLHRSVPPAEILPTCFNEWEKSVSPAGRVSSTRLQEARAAFEAEKARPAKERHPVATYQKISEALGKQKQKI